MHPTYIKIINNYSNPVSLIVVGSALKKHVSNKLPNIMVDAN